MADVQAFRLLEVRCIIQILYDVLVRFSNRSWIGMVVTWLNYWMPRNFPQALRTLAGLFGWRSSGCSIVIRGRSCRALSYASDSWACGNVTRSARSPPSPDATTTMMWPALILIAAPSPSCTILPHQGGKAEPSSSTSTPGCTRPSTIWSRLSECTSLHQPCRGRMRMQPMLQLLQLVNRGDLGLRRGWVRPCDVLAVDTGASAGSKAALLVPPLSMLECA